MSSAKKEITVVINGEEFVSKAAKEAEAGLTVFGMRIPIVLDASALLTKGLDLLRAGFQAAKDWVVNSLAAYDAYAASQRKLEGTSKLTGVALKDLQDIAKTGTEGFKLSTVTANEYSAEIAKLTSKAGDLGKSKDAMAAFLDIGAARGLNANETLKAVQQAILGIDEGTDKLFGKNPSVLYEEYAAKIGKSAGKLSDQEKAMALLDATMEGGERVKGAYLDYLNSAAGQQDLMNQRIEQSQVSFGTALQPLRTLVLQGLNKMLDVLLPLVDWLGKAATSVGVTLVQGVNRGRETIGNLASAVGRLTGNKELQQWGKDQAASAQESIRAVDETVRKAAEGTKSSADTVQSAHKANTKVTEEELKKQEKEWKKFLKSAEDTYKMLHEGVIATTEAAKRLGPAVQKSLEPQHVSAFNAAMTGARENADMLMANMKAGGIDNVDVMDRLRSHLRTAGVSLSDMTRGVLDGAQAFGLMDRETGAVLNSVVNVGSAIGKIMSVGSGALFAGVPAILAGVSSIVSSMMQGDKERRELTRANTEALNKLRTDGVRLSNKATGDQISGIAGALDPDLIGLLGKMTGEHMRGAGNQMLTNALAQAGLRLSDLDAVAGELGFNLRRENGQVELSQLPMFFKALQENMGALTRIGQTFGEQLDFFKESQRLTGANGVGQIQGLLDYLQNAGGVRALSGVDLSDPTKARQSLLDMFVGLNNNVFSAQDLGRLTGDQFKNAITELIGLLDSLDTSAAAESSPSPTPQTTAVVESVDGVSVSVASVQEVITAMDGHLIAVLSSYETYWQRTADATEASALHLASIDDKMDSVIAGVNGQTDRVNAALANSRALAEANAGRGPSF